MMFFPVLPRRSATLHRALKSAVAGHRPVIVRELLARHGVAAFAAALSPQPGRFIADAISMLPAAERARVQRRLPRAARERYLHVGGPALCAPGRNVLIAAWCALSGRGSAGSAPRTGVVRSSPPQARRHADGAGTCQGAA